ncbi:hypothetical protein LDVICp210 [lymphocystis disease virus-China]|uniref:Uncharacterized protein n=1 Tax=lymphocystis disease virus-China TaxID=256729 RepID=Q677Q4_9VIRU|nr:hypothetical protein LDVICp210 [lymphocystis disease virus-China]AAU11053.1 hypothetical protein [lymphocystis disease virus-China]
MFAMFTCISLNPLTSKVSLTQSIINDVKLKGKHLLILKLYIHLFVYGLCVKGLMQYSNPKQEMNISLCCYRLIHFNPLTSKMSLTIVWS